MNVSLNVCMENLKTENKSIETEIKEKQNEESLSSSESKHRRNVLFIFGCGECGQLPQKYCSNGSEENPVQVESLPSDIVEVICGSMHTIVKTKDDKLFSFGCNDMGVLGRNTGPNACTNVVEEGSGFGKLHKVLLCPEDEPLLIKTNFDDTIRKITCGDNHTAVLLNNGKVFITGGFRDGSGLLGLPSFKNKNEIIDNTCSFIEVKFNYFEKEHEQVNGEVGTELNVDDFLKEHKIIDIVSGEDHLICLCENKEYIYTMGNSDSCQVCNPLYEEHESEQERLKYIFPHKYHYKNDLKLETKIKQIFAGGNNTFVQLEESLDVYGIGRNAYGSCGVSKKEEKIIPTFQKIEQLSKKEIKQLCGGQSFTVCLLKNNDLYVWGNRELLGKPDIMDDTYEPVEMNFFKNNNLMIRSISCGTDHCLVLTENAKLFAWGVGGNAFDINKTAGALENPTPIEIKYLNFFDKIITLQSTIDQSTFLKNVRIESFSGGSAHAAYISSYVASSPVTAKRSREENEEESLQMVEEGIHKKKQKERESINEEYDNTLRIDEYEKEKKEPHINEYLEETIKDIKNPEKENYMTVHSGIEKNEEGSVVENDNDSNALSKNSVGIVKGDKNKNEENEIMEENEEEDQDEYVSISSGDHEEMDNDLMLKTEEKTSNSNTFKNEQNNIIQPMKSSRSRKSRTSLQQHSPTRTQPKRSCKENITSLNENERVKRYQIVETPIKKKRSIRKAKSAKPSISKSTSVKRKTLSQPRRKSTANEKREKDQSKKEEKTEESENESENEEGVTGDVIDQEEEEEEEEEGTSEKESEEEEIENKKNKQEKNKEEKEEEEEDESENKNEEDDDEKKKKDKKGKSTKKENKKKEPTKKESETKGNKIKDNTKKDNKKDTVTKRESTKKETSKKEISKKDTARKESVRKETTKRESTKKETAKKETTKSENIKKGSTNEHSRRGNVKRESVH